MSIKTVGILSPGDMGAATGGVLRQRGLDVVTCLEGRGDLTRLRAKEAGFRVVDSFDQLVREVDTLLSIVPPADALKLAEKIAEPLRANGASLTYVDFNAVSPQMAVRIGAVITAAGSRFVDGGIIGSPPSPTTHPRFYISGEDAASVIELGRCGLDVRQIGDKIGQASGLKMVYAASTKGTTALWTELLVAARMLGLSDALAQELDGSPVYKVAKAAIPTMPRRSRRWVGEMEEIAATFKALGLTPHMLLGAAEMFQLVGSSPLGSQTSRQPDPTLEETIDNIAANVRQDARPVSPTRSRRKRSED